MKQIGSALLGIQQYKFQPPTPTLSITIHSITDKQADDSYNMSIWCENKSETILTDRRRSVPCIVYWAV